MIGQAFIMCCYQKGTQQAGCVVTGHQQMGAFVLSCTGALLHRSTSAEYFEFGVTDTLHQGTFDQTSVRHESNQIQAVTKWRKSGFRVIQQSVIGPKNPDQSALSQLVSSCDSVGLSLINTKRLSCCENRIAGEKQKEKNNQIRAYN